MKETIDNQAVHVRNAKNLAFRKAVSIAVQFSDWECLAECYKLEKLTEEEKKYLEFFLRHLYLTDNFGGYYGNA